MVKQLKAKKIKVLLMTSIPVQEGLYYNKYPEVKQLYANKGGIRSWLNSYNDIIRKVANKEKVYLVDHYANAVLKAGGATDAKLSASGLVDEAIGFHWTPRGHSMITYSVKHYLAKQ
jgi:lysophospholipase L1-like esterase